MMMPKASLRIDEIQRRPITVLESPPYDMLIVHCDRITDVHFLQGPAHVAHILFKGELRRMDADHYQPLIFVLVGPGADIRKLPQPVDAGVGPEIDQDDLPAQSLRRQGWRIQPLVRTLERSELGRATDLARGKSEGTEPTPLRMSSVASLSFP